MKTRVFTDATEFASLVRPILEENEAENNLPLGIISMLCWDTTSYKNALLAVVHENSEPESGNIVSIALRTPPFPVIITYSPEAARGKTAANIKAASCLYDTLESLSKEHLCGLNADTRVIEPYVEIWESKLGIQAETRINTRIYRCDEVRFPRSVQGKARNIQAADKDILTELITGFYLEAVPHDYSPERVTDLVARQLSADPSQRGMLLWEVNGEIVSMAGYSGPTRQGMRLNLVYTPKQHRGYGYASACTAQLTQNLLDSGRRFCTLFTDLSNPISNSIYQQIGYTAVSDYQHYGF